MLNKIKMNYSGTIKIKNKEYIFDIASSEDINAIAELYADTAINYGNYNKKLSKESKSNFSENGGMFVVLNKEEIQEEIKRDENLWAVIKDKENHLMGSFWFSTKNKYFEGSEYENLEGLIYPREIVVSKKINTKYIGRLLYYTVVYAMQRGGYKQSICDVYKARDYEADGKRLTVNLLNNRSVSLLVSVGAEFKGVFPIRKIELKGITVWIEPQVYYLDHKKVIKKCNKFFNERNIQICWG